MSTATLTFNVPCITTSYYSLSTSCLTFHLSFQLYLHFTDVSIMYFGLCVDDKQGIVICSQLVEIIRNFTPQQVEVISEKSGFRAVLQYEPMKIRRELCKELVDSFDVNTDEFNI
uniref:Uncharacterized protein n=1 Tax=Arundo donax TaxID=35708 RepID=A0A0A9ET16_ARUDO